jgi:glycosyltransferase involved in cell wall biosynthesis
MNYRILHTESSNGWGGQEIRILKEAEGMRSRGHEVIFAVVRGGKLVAEAQKAGFIVYELGFRRGNAISDLRTLMGIIRKHHIDMVNTHSSWDAWMGGIAARFMKKKIIRTRHLSTPIRKGLNSKILYKGLADFTVTTSSAVVATICNQAKIGRERCRCIPTGVEPIEVSREAVEAFRKSLDVGPDDILVGTACVVRSWKGIQDLMRAAELLKEHKNIKWVVVGGGYLHEYRDLIDLKGVLTFTGHLPSPYAAVAAMDIFVLLSTAHEGISQSSLQAAYLERPLITTTVGGLPEVNVEGKTGYLVPPASPQKVAEAVLKLVQDPDLRAYFGRAAKTHVQERFMLKHTLDQMESVYAFLFPQLTLSK